MNDNAAADLPAINNNKVTRYLIDDLSLDVQRGELTRLGESITLPKLSYDLLVALAQAAPALLSQQELMQKVWPDRIIGDETLKQRVKLLRKSIDDDASNPKYIEAVRGRGYRLLPQVSCECVIKRSPSVMLDLAANDFFPNLLSASLHRWWRRVSVISLLFFGLLVMSVMVTSLFYQQEPQFADNNLQITNSLEQQVGKSTFNLYQRGREYYKRYRAQDNIIAIDFFHKAIAASPTFSEAYAGLSQAYSQRYFQFGGNEQSKQRAIDNAYLAISYNNNSADAYKALGTAYYVSGWLSKSINALLRGFNLSPNNKELLTNLAFIYSEQGKFEQALFWHKKTLQLAPDYAIAMLHLAITLQRIEHTELALSWYEKALAQKPDYVLTTYHLAQLYIELGQVEKARKVINKGMFNQSSHPLLLEALADSYFFQGELALAKGYYQQVADIQKNSPVNQATIRSLLLLKDTYKPDDEKQNNGLLFDPIIKQLVGAHLAGNEKPKISLYLAEVYALLNNETLVFRYLVQALEQGQVLNYQINSAPLFEEVKQLDRYKKLHQQLQSQKVLPNIDDYFYEMLNNR